jgi:ATP-binding protein involved in chromosome partitioning
VRSLDIQGDRVNVQLATCRRSVQKGWAQLLQMAIEGLDGVRRRGRVTA